MESMINFGIDLGTTNSVIAKFVKGEVQVFTNPQDFGRATLPSVVAFKKDSMFVGSRAKAFAQHKPKDVVARFKRKMGTTEAYKIPAINQSKTPVELSACVLKELKTFVNTGETLDAAVITIPASFDTIQSNATKEAGHLAGFKQVVLLQEPIAASLAYANKAKNVDLTDGQWLVYDLGGGTFDVALVKISDGEMKVLDHEGDNFLGGTDFDDLIVRKFIIPKLEEAGRFSRLEEKMTSASGGYNAAYYVCLAKAEEAKIQLSAQTSAEIDFGANPITDEAGDEIDACFVLTRSEFEALIRPHVDKTIELVKKIVTRNSLSPRDLQFVLMVGGSTFIPYVRRRVEEVLQVRVNTEIDPTTAVAVGAAYYAGSKPKESDSTAAARKPSALRFKCVYEKATREPEVYFAAKIVEGDPKGLFYKITRLDGGFDTGLKPLSKDFSEDLPLMPNEYNYFKLTIFDAQNNVVETGLDLIGVAHGKFSIAAQPLPNDICLEVDDVETGGSRSELVFAKNTGLPVRKTLTKTLNKTIVKGSDECLHINVLEGSHQSLPEANLVIGHLQITGKQLSRDVARGSDIEITIEISESRDVTIGAYLNMSDQSFSQIFNPKERHVPVEFLKKEIRDMLKKIENEISLAEEREDYEMLKELRPVLSQIKELHSESLRLASDDVTDARYQLDDKKRKIAQEFDNATKTKRLSEAKAEYEEIKRRCQTALKEGGNDYERKIFQEIVAQERVFLASGGATKIREKIDELHGLCIQILRRQPEFLIALFKHLTENTRRMNDREQADLLAQAGFSAIHAKDWERLDHVNSALISLLPNSARQDLATKIGFA